jgi:hypothetical protein
MTTSQRPFGQAIGQDPVLAEHLGQLVGVLLCAPRRIIWSSRKPNQRSTWLTQLDPVGVKCMWKRGWRSSQAWWRRWGDGYAAVRVTTAFKNGGVRHAGARIRRGRRRVLLVAVVHGDVLASFDVNG